LSLVSSSSHIVNSINEPGNKLDIALAAVGILLASLVTGLVCALFGGLIAFLLLVVFVSMGVATFNYRYGVFISVLLLPLSSTRLVPREVLGITGLNPLNAVFGVSVLALSLLWAFQRKKLVLPNLPLSFRLYLSVMVIASMIGATHVDEMPSMFNLLQIVRFESIGGYLRDILFKPLIIVGIVYMLGVAVANANKADSYLVLVFASALLMPTIVIGYVGASGASLAMLSKANARGFLSALGIHANELGLMFNTCYALALFCFFAVSNRTAKLFLLLTICILAIAVMLSFSRGAFLGFIAINGYLLYNQRRFGLILVAGIVVLILFFIMPEAVIERATTGLANRDISAISAGRVGMIWMPLLPEFFSHPFFGQGMSSVLWAGAARRGTMLPVGHPHSAYLGMLLDFGVVGSVFVITFFVHMWKTFYNLAKFHNEKIWRAFFQGGCACVLLALIQGITDDRVTPTLPQTFLWVAYGVALGIKTRVFKDIKDAALVRTTNL
jgi:hypothetical protein